jgi:hypothetical protein
LFSARPMPDLQVPTLDPMIGHKNNTEQLAHPA